MITNGDLKIELLHYAEPEATGSPSTSRGQIGFTHLSFFVDDVDRVAAKLAQLGGTILADTRAQLGYEVVFVADPDGARVGAHGATAPKNYAAAFSNVISMRPRPLRLAR